MMHDLNIPYTQYLNDKNELVSALPEFADDQSLIQLYETMVLLRRYDAKAIELQRTGKMGTYPSALGQEAISVAIGHAMKSEDVYCSSYRDYGVHMQRGTGFEQIYAYWGGDERGCDLAAKEDFPLCVPLATQCLHAAGVASAIKIRKENRVVVVTCGDGATSRGDFYEAINVAGAWHLPIVFVLVDNKWAISVPRETQTAVATLAQKAYAAGFEGEQVDGNDVIAVRERVHQAIERARSGEGPQLIEALTYRLSDHTTADDATRYRQDEEVKTAWQKEPVIRLRTYLADQGLWDENKEKALLNTCKERVSEAVKTYENMTPQKPEAMFDHLYETLPDAYLDQYDELLQGGQS